MNAVVNLVRKFPNTTLAVAGILTSALTVKTIKLQLSRLETLQITRAVEDLKLEDAVTNQMLVHGPYYK